MAHNDTMFTLKHFYCFALKLTVSSRASECSFDCHSSQNQLLVTPTICFTKYQYNKVLTLMFDCCSKYLTSPCCLVDV